VSGSALEGQIVVANDIEIDDEAGPVVVTITQEVMDARGHGALLTRFNEPRGSH
jgi:hypothetical protein